MTTLVDANVLLDLTTNDETWQDWSFATVREASRNGIVAINPIIYAEVSVSFDGYQSVDIMLKEAGVETLDIPRPALFLAGRAFQLYRQRGGTRTGVLPDFFIGAHASCIGARLLTRDTRHFRSYFPDVELITPNQ